jgi:hypothetical protein
MTIFGDFLKQVRIKSIKIGPVTWDVEQTDGSKIKELKQLEVQTEEEKEKLIQEDIRVLDDLINSLENFNSNPEAIYYIGQTLVRCDSYLEDNGVVGEPMELTLALIDEMDNDERKDMGLFDPVLSISKINKLKRCLKSIRADIVTYEKSA